MSLRLNMALELAKHNPVYEDIASKFFEVGLVLLSIDFTGPVTTSNSTLSSSQML
jgi:hypothetical protein